MPSKESSRNCSPLLSPSAYFPFSLFLSLLTGLKFNILSGKIASPWESDSKSTLRVEKDQEKASNTDTMEEQKVMNNNGRKRTQISINGGGGGIGGLIVLGGALAVTGLIAVASFATKKNKAKNRGFKKPEFSQEKLDHNGSKNEDETGQGLSFVLQNSTPNDETEW